MKMNMNSGDHQARQKPATSKPQAQRKGILGMVKPLDEVLAQQELERDKALERIQIMSFELGRRSATEIDIKNLKVDSRNYDSKNATLVLGGVPIQIQKHFKGRGDRLNETKEARVLRLLFNPVKDISAGIEFHKVLPVAAAQMNHKKVKLVKNYIAQINKKIKAAGGPSELIIFNQTKVYINSSYL